MLNVIGKRKTYLTVSAVLVLAAIVCIGVFKFEEGIDFKGGTLWEFKVENTNANDLQSFFTGQLGIADARISQGSASDDFLARIAPETEEVHKAFLQKLQAKYPTFQELSFSSIGPSVGAELRKNSLIAIALVLIGISLYIAFAFRKVYRPISSWKYGWVTLATLLHDVAIPAGLLAILGHFKGIEIDSNFIVALLVVMGFSVHDTIVVFDRIRENLLLNRGKSGFGEIINESVNQTLARSINTSLTLILVLLALYFAGPVNLKYFVLTLLVGVITGIYSSIFVASPLLLVWHNWSNKGTGQRSG
jgi:preprotein translocase subunit SecF